MKRTLPEAVRDLLIAKTGESLVCLEPTCFDDKRAHAARKALKSARAALRMLRPRLGDAAYSRENITLRDAARDLSPLRDARSLLEALDLLDRDARQRRSVKAALARLRPLLQVRLKQARKELAANPGALRHCNDCVRGSRERVRATLNEPGDVRQLIEGFTRIYRNARNAYRQAECECSDEALHEWRKQTKYLLTAAATLRASGVKKLRRVVKRADQIADRLGDDHDLAVLSQILFDFAGDSDSKMLLPLIERCRVTLQRRALYDGIKLFAHKPRQVAAIRLPTRVE
jgi:CHAD domain-containing protein